MWDWKAALASDEAKVTRKRGGYDVWATLDLTPQGLTVVNSLDHRDAQDAAPCIRGKNDVIISGTRSEEWASGRESAEANYDAISTDGVVLGPATAANIVAARHEAGWDPFDADPFESALVWARLRAKQGPANLGIIVPEGVGEVEVATAWGSVEHGGAGSLILAPVGPDGGPDLSDCRLVQVDVAASTYDLSPWDLPMTDPPEAPYPCGVFTPSGLVGNDDLAWYQAIYESEGLSAVPRDFSDRAWWADFAKACGEWETGDHGAADFGRLLGCVFATMGSIADGIGDDEGDLLTRIMEELPIEDLKVVGVDVVSLMPGEEYGFETVITEPHEVSLTFPVGRVGAFDAPLVDGDWGLTDAQTREVLDGFERGFASVSDGGASREIPEAPEDVADADRELEGDFGE